MAGLGLPGRHMHVEHAHERIVEHELVRVRRNLQRIQGIGCLTERGACHRNRENQPDNYDQLLAFHVSSLRVGVSYQ